MNDGQLDDLKQFIEAMVSQSEARLEHKLGGLGGLGGRIDKLDGTVSAIDFRLDRLDTRLDSLEQKQDDGFAGIADILEPLLEKQDDHEKRLTALELPSAA